MHKQLSLTVLTPKVNFFENSVKPDKSSIENSADPDIHTVFKTTCKFKIANPELY